MLDFTYVDDCVAGVAAGIDLLVSGREANQVINLAYGTGNSLVTLAEYIGEELGVAPDIDLRPSRLGEVTHYVANIGKARALLAYDPAVPLREGIHRAVRWATDYWNGQPPVTP